MTGKPLDGSKPVTNGQLAEAINRAHDCIHNVGDRVDALAVTVGKNRTDAADRDQALGERMSRVEGALGVATRPGRRSRPVRTKLAGLSLWQGVFSLMALDGRRRRPLQIHRTRGDRRGHRAAPGPAARGLKGPPPCPSSEPPRPSRCATGRGCSSAPWCWR
jgi:hypothetical protein